jgi:hypothetical protein
MRLKVQRYGPGSGPGLTTFSFSLLSESYQRAMNLLREEQLEEPVDSLAYTSWIPLPDRAKLRRAPLARASKELGAEHSMSTSARSTKS